MNRNEEENYKFIADLTELESMDIKARRKAAIKRIMQIPEFWDVFEQRFEKIYKWREPNERNSCLYRYTVWVPHVSIIAFFIGFFVFFYISKHYEIINLFYQNTQAA